MKTVILAGGLGTRLSEETVYRPKPMVEIGGKPMLWHIMNIYARHGFGDFIVACGYKGEIIKEYFRNFYAHDSDCVVDLKNGKVSELDARAPEWKVTMIDTGLQTGTGGRLRRLKKHLGKEAFMATYGDGVGNVDLAAVVAFHRKHGKAATITAVRPPARFGGLTLKGDRVDNFSEKPQTGEGWVNGGFFVFEPRFLDYIDGDESVLERAPLERASSEGELMAYRHDGFWQPMDTQRDQRLLEGMWASGTAPWKTW